MHKRVVIFQTHAMDWFSRRALRKLSRQLSGYADVVVQGFSGAVDSLPREVDGLPCVGYTRHDLLSLPYPCKTDAQNWKLIPGNTDLMLLRFWRDNPGYEHYWIVEYDVRYTGHWGRFMQRLEGSRADVLATNVLRYADVPDWNHWPSLAAPGGVNWARHAVRAFLPVCRMSAAACQAVDRAYRDGWGGHNEAVWATVACSSGLVVEDIGGNGPFTPPSRRGRYYTSTPTALSLTPGSFGYRPMRPLALPIPGRLWHPVKPRECFWNLRARLKAVGKRALHGYAGT